MRVIFDRSSFHGELFKTLTDSPLRDLVKRRCIEVLLTPVFISETVEQYGSESKVGRDWREHLKFAAEICNGGVFLATREIWHDELVCGRGTEARHSFPEYRTKRYGRSRADVLSQLIEIANTDDLDNPWQAGAAGREEIHRKKDQLRARYSQVRAQVSEALSRKAYAHSTWPEYLRNDFITVGRGLMRQVHKTRSAELGDVWARDPHRYPFYSAFVEGFMYALFHAGEVHNVKLDRNSQADYEQLAFLTRADIIVSDERNFMKHAFDALWAHRGKRFLTAQQFAEFTTAVHRVAPA